MRRTLLRTAIAVMGVMASLAALIWPWPAPEVDWRTPTARALAANDCATAIEILSAAAGAGSSDAYAQARPLLEGGRCKGTPAGEGMGDYIGFLMLHHGASLDNIYEVDGLSPPRRHAVATVLYLCAMPYNGAAGVDHTAIAEVVPGDHGILMGAHRARRALCLRVLESLGGELVDADDHAALSVAHALLINPPLARSHRAAVQYARLLLEKNYSRRPDDKPFTDHMRGFAWLRLERAAASGEVDAIRMMIEHLHEGRHRPRDDAEAYFWILRLRRLGHDHALAAEIERALEDGERLKAEVRDANCDLGERYC